jgi:hypothetical protein
VASGAQAKHGPDARDGDACDGVAEVQQLRPVKVTSRMCSQRSLHFADVGLAPNEAGSGCGGGCSPGWRLHKVGS